MIGELIFALECSPGDCGYKITYEFSSKDNLVDLNGEQMNDVEVGVEALCQTFGQVFLERDVQVRVPFYRFLQFLKTIAQICPFFCSLKGLVDALKLRLELLHLSLYITKVMFCYCMEWRGAVLPRFLEFLVDSTIVKMFVSVIVLEYLERSR